MRVVIDTNVFISSRLSPAGNPAKVMDLITAGKIALCYSENILKEYKRVLAYEKFNFSIDIQKLLIDDVVNIGNLISHFVSEIPLPDESDRIFYDTAKAADAYLITGNTKHFPDEPRILTPAQFVEMYEN